MMRVSIDTDACMGTAFCGRIAPQLFRLDETTLVSSVLQADVPPELEDAAREAETACPAAAIVVTEGRSDG
jgi:ferredoxin